MADNKFSVHDLACKVDELISLCGHLHGENEKLRAVNARMRAQDHGTKLNQRTTYHNVKNVVTKIRNLEEKI